jgi:transketolase
MAFADRIAGRPGRVFCILGDGELHEGNVWEAVMSAAHHRLERLVAIVDANGIMSKGRLDEYLAVEPLGDKLRSFGWTVSDIDGHDLDAVTTALDRAREGGTGRPTAIIARTLKGKGLVGFEDSHRWHTHAPDPETADAMVRGLARMYGRPERGYSRIGQPVKKETFHV